MYAYASLVHELANLKIRPLNLCLPGPFSFRPSLHATWQCHRGSATVAVEHVTLSPFEYRTMVQYASRPLLLRSPNPVFSSSRAPSWPLGGDVESAARRLVTEAKGSDVARFHEKASRRRALRPLVCVSTVLNRCHGAIAATWRGTPAGLW